MFHLSIPVSCSSLVSPVSPAPPSSIPVLSAAYRTERRVNEQTAQSPAAHPQSSTLSRLLPEAIRSSHKHTRIHSLHFYLLVTIFSLLLSLLHLLPLTSISSSVPLLPLSPPFILRTKALFPPHLFSSPILPLPLFPPFCLFFGPCSIYGVGCWCCISEQASQAYMDKNINAQLGWPRRLSSFDSICTFYPHSPL